MKLHCVWQQKALTAFYACFWFRFFAGEKRKGSGRNTIFRINNKLQQTLKRWKYKNPYGVA